MFKKFLGMICLHFLQAKSDCYLKNGPPVILKVMGLLILNTTFLWLEKNGYYTAGLKQCNSACHVSELANHFPNVNRGFSHNC